MLTDFKSALSTVFFNSLLCLQTHPEEKRYHEQKFPIAWGTLTLEISEPVPRDCDSVGLGRAQETCFYINDSGAQAGMRNPVKARGSWKWDEQNMNADSILLCDHGLITSLRLGYLFGKMKTTVHDRNVLRAK